MSTSIFIRDTPVASLLSDCWPGSRVDGVGTHWPPSHTIWPTLWHQSSGWLPAAAPDTLAVILDPDRLAGGLQAKLTAFSAESDEWLLAPDGSVLTACEGSTPSRTCTGSLQPAWGCGFRSAPCCWLFNPRGSLFALGISTLSPSLSGSLGLVTKMVPPSALRRLSLLVHSREDSRCLHFVALSHSAVI